MGSYGQKEYMGTYVEAGPSATKTIEELRMIYWPEKVVTAIIKVENRVPERSARTFYEDQIADEVAREINDMRMDK